MTTRFKFGDRSEGCLVGVHPQHVKVVRLALLISGVDFAVIEGLRPPVRQRELYNQGRSAPGKIVTWTMQSKHLVQSDGFGHATDLVPVNPDTGKIDWNYAEGFLEIGAAMMAASKYLGIETRWGHDWDRDGVLGEKGETDSPHFERVA